MALFNDNGSIAEGPGGYSNYQKSGPGEPEGNTSYSNPRPSSGGGGGGKKGGPAAAPAVPDSGIAEMMAAYTQSMSLTMMNMMEMMSSISQQQPSVPELPSIYEPPDIDWTEEREKLAQKMKADTALERARKTTRNSTVLTSPLLDDEEPTTTSSLLKKG